MSVAKDSRAHGRIKVRSKERVLFSPCTCLAVGRRKRKPPCTCLYARLDEARKNRGRAVLFAADETKRPF